MYVEVLQEIKDAFHFPLTKQTDIKTYTYIYEQNVQLMDYHLYLFREVAWEFFLLF